MIKSKLLSFNEIFLFTSIGTKVNLSLFLSLSQSPFSEKLSISHPKILSFFKFNLFPKFIINSPSPVPISKIVSIFLSFNISFNLFVNNSLKIVFLLHEILDIDVVLLIFFLNKLYNLL
jgi:hypothetical protein